ncbi:MAG: hypothetical protein LBV28_03165, partial [Puniceicoccales bacterium]|nr:hypothetical protein [Puniceicoccales bacterium]
MHSLLNRIYIFLTNRWRIPFAPGNYSDLLVLLVLFGVFGLFTVWRGGMTAAALPWGARLVAIAIGFHLLTLATRAATTGFRLYRGTLFFLPWLLWSVLDWAFFSPKPWQAETGLITGCMVFTVFSLALYHLRHPWLKWIVGGLAAALVSVVASFAVGGEAQMTRWLFSIETDFIYASFFSSTLAHPAGMGAVMLMMFFPCCVVALGYRWRYWQRMLAAYFSVIFLLGIFSSRHFWLLVAFFVGAVIMSALVARRLRTRALFVAIGAVALVLASGDAARNVGLFRTGELVKPSEVVAPAVVATPLAQVAWDVIKEAPLQGSGTGGFALNFEKNRPVGWTSSPTTPGSLPLALLAEHGAVGFLLLVVPAVWIWFSALSACLAIPCYEQDEKYASIVVGVSNAGKHKRITKLRRRRAPMPEERLFLGGVLSGTAAAALLLVFDYPGPMPAVACLFALLGAAMLRQTPQASLDVAQRKILAPVLRGAAFLKPVLWLLWVLAPLSAGRLVEEATSQFVSCLPTIEQPHRSVVVASVENLLDGTEDAARTAIGNNPANGDAWELLARVALRRYPVQPDRGPRLASLALYASEEALRRAPQNFEFHLTHGAAFFMTGDNASAVAAFQKARRLAPHDAATALLLADA